MRDALQSRAGLVTVLGIGMAMGWLISGFQARPLQAGAVDRSGEYVVATGPVLVQYDEGTKSPIALEALYFLDYKGGRLMATIPSYRAEGVKTQIIDGFAERDLVADFKLEAGARPRFAMTTGSLGRYTAGWAPLYVFETTTGQVAVYRMQVGQSYGTAPSSQFELIEIRPYINRTAGAPPRL